MHDVDVAMLQGDRGEDQDFAPDERLYIRIPPSLYYCDKYGTERINPAAFRLPDMSLNRSKHGGRAHFVRCNVYPKDAPLCNGNHHDWAVVSFKKREAERTLIDHPETVRFMTRVIHKPEQFNYYHSEIQAFDESDVHIEKANIDKLGRLAKLRWQACLCESSTIVIDISS